MAKLYKIRDGFSFVDSDNTVKTGGDTIELADDIAAQHQHKLEPVEPEKEPKKAAPTGDGKTAGADQQ